MYSQVIARLATTNILCENRYGFRNKMSCYILLLTVINDLVKGLGAIFLNFSQAFDKAHRPLLLKLVHHWNTGKYVEND